MPESKVNIKATGQVELAGVKRIRQAITVPVIGALVGVGLYAILAVQTGAWQYWIPAGALSLAIVSALSAPRVAARGHLATAHRLLIVAVIIAYGGTELSLAGLTLPLILGGVLIIVLTVSLFVQHRPWSTLLSASSAYLLCFGLINLLAPPRHSVANEPIVIAFAIAVTVVITLALVGLIAQVFTVGTIRTRLIIAFLVVTFVPLAVQAALSYSATRQLAIDNANQRLSSAAVQTAAIIDGFINANLDAISNEARLPEFSDYLALPAGDRKLDTALQAKMDLLLATLKAKQIRAISVVQRSQLYVLSYSLVDRDGLVLLSTAPNVGRSLADLDYIRQPLNTGTAYVSPILFTPENPIGSLYFAAPVKSANGETLGVLVTRYNGGQMLQLLVAANIGQVGEEALAILVDENHLRLAHSTDINRIFKTVAPLDPARVAELQAARRLPFKPAEELSTDLADFEAALSNKLNRTDFVAELGESGEDGTSESNLDQAAIAGLKTQPWFLVFAQPQAVFLQPVANQLNSLLARAAILGVLVVLAAIGLSRLLAQPIVRLTTVAEKVTAGDLAAQAEVGSNDEVGRLAAAFNSMTGQLRSLIGSLESRVAARTEQLRTGAEVGRAAASVLDAERLLTAAVNLITDRFDYYYAAVFTLDTSGKYAVLRAATGDAGRILKERGHRLQVGGQSMVGTVTANRQARIALDVGTEAVRFANPLLPDTRSEIALPLIVGDKVLGALDVQATTEAAFDENSATVLQAMADQIAVALNNAALFAQSRQIAQQARTLYQASRVVGRGESDASITIKTMMQLVEKQLDYSQWWVVKLDEHRRVLQPLGTSGQAIPVADQPNSPAVRSALHGESIVVNDPEHDPHLQNVPLQRRSGIGKFVSVPIVMQDEPIGALLLGRSVEAADLGETDLDLANSLASLAAFAIENWQLHEQTQNVLAELDRVNRRLTGESWSAFTHQRSQGVLWVSTTDQVQQANWPEVGEALTTGQITTRSLNGDGRLGVAIPIVLRDTAIGALHIVVSQQQYTPELRATLGSIASHVAQAAENMRLLEDTERLARRERTINEINSRVRQTIDLDTILKTAVTELGQSLKAARVTARVSAPASHPSTVETSSSTSTGRGDHHA